MAQKRIEIKEISHHMARAAEEHSSCRGGGKGVGPSAGRAQQRHGADLRVDAVLAALRMAQRSAVGQFL